MLQQRIPERKVLYFFELLIVLIVVNNPYDFIGCLWCLAIAELYDLLGRRQKLTATGPWTRGRMILTHARGTFSLSTFD